jgi:hypothetical protein
VNGQELSLQNAQQVIGGMFAWQEGMEITMDLERNGQPVRIEAQLTKPTAISQSIIENADASAEQIEIRNAWLKG